MPEHLVHNFYWTAIASFLPKKARSGKVALATSTENVTMNPKYDDIGEGYDITRKAEPEILDTLNSLYNVEGGKKYLDVACGTGNYTTALSKIDDQWHAIDNSEKMLAEARSKSNKVHWSQSDVENLNYELGYFDGAICSLAIHHFANLTSAFFEIA